MFSHQYELKNNNLLYTETTKGKAQVQVKVSLKITLLVESIRWKQNWFKGQFINRVSISQYRVYTWLYNVCLFIYLVCYILFLSLIFDSAISDISIFQRFYLLTKLAVIKCWLKISSLIKLMLIWPTFVSKCKIYNSNFTYDLALSNQQQSESYRFTYCFDSMLP